VDYFRSSVFFNWMGGDGYDRPVSLISLILSKTVKLQAFVEKHQKENLSLEGFILNKEQ